MNLALFDTHAFVKRLTAAGMPEAQAEVLADEHARLVDERLATKADIAPLATKSELDTARLALEHLIETNKLDLQRQIEANKTDILKWMVGSIGFQTLVLLGAAAGFIKLAHP